MGLSNLSKPNLVSVTSITPILPDTFGDMVISNELNKFYINFAGEKTGETLGIDNLTIMAKVSSMVAAQNGGVDPTFIETTSFYSSPSTLDHSAPIIFGDGVMQFNYHPNPFYNEFAVIRETSFNKDLFLDFFDNTGALQSSVDMNFTALTLGLSSFGTPCSLNTNIGSGNYFFGAIDSLGNAVVARFDTINMITVLNILNIQPPGWNGTSLPTLIGVTENYLFIVCGDTPIPNGRSAIHQYDLFFNYVQTIDNGTGVAHPIVIAPINQIGTCNEQYLVIWMYDEISGQPFFRRIDFNTLAYSDFTIDGVADSSGTLRRV